MSALLGGQRHAACLPGAIVLALLPAVLLSCAIVQAAPSPARDASVTTIASPGAALPRAFGFSIGDRLQQRIALGTPDAPFLLAELPRLGRIGSSLWRHRSQQQIDASGQHWLILDYQLVNTPPVLSIWYLPTLTLKAQSGAATLTVASTPFSIGPITQQQPVALAGLPLLQPDQAVPLAPLAPVARRVRLSALALALVLLVWGMASGWHYLRRARHLPFASLVRHLQALGNTDPLGSRRLLHQALNTSAGSVVQPGTLNVLLDRTPYLREEYQALETFLAQSQAIFFGGVTPGEGDTALPLARRLMRLERRYAR